MNKIFNLSLSLLLIAATSVTAQVRLFEKGYIVQQGDTLRGYIKNATDLELTTTVEFKDNLTVATPTTYTPEQLTSFGFEVTGVVHATVKAEIIKGATTNEVTRFAKLILTGYTSLHKLQLPENERSVELLKHNTFVYVLKKDAAFYTLGVYETYADGIVRTNNRFRGVLRAVFSDCETYQDKLDHLSFNDESIIEEIKKYNTCKAPAIATTLHTFKPKAVIKHGFEGFYMKGSIGDRDSYKSEGYAGGYFWDIMHTDKSRNLSGKFGIGYMHYQYEDLVLDVPTSKTVSYLRFPAALQYNIMQDLTSAFIPFINVGATVLTTPNFDFDELQFMQSVGIGMYYGRVRFTAGLENTRFTKGLTLLNFGLGVRLDDALPKK